MSTIKFRYRIYSITEKRVMETFYKSLDDIQNWLSILCDKKNYEILSRDEFTWLLDKNGKELYEGDILREPSKNEWENINYACFEVFFHDGDANSDYNIGYSMNRSHFHWSICWYFIPPFKTRSVSKMEVIGNIHENPELLNK